MAPPPGSKPQAPREEFISGGMSKAIAEARGKHISKLVQARLDALLEGCELYGFLDDQLATDILKEVMNLKREDDW